MTALPTEPCSAVILAGGLNSRFGGRNKAMIEWKGRPLLDHIQDALADLFAETILVTNAPERYAARDIMLVTDLHDVRSSLTGIQAGLFYASLPFVFVTACDTPLLRPQLLRLLQESAGGDCDAVIPRTAKGLEPLCAIYSRRCLEPITRHLQSGDYRIRSALQRMKVQQIPEEQLRRADPDLRSLFNINTPGDLEEALRRFAQTADGEAEAPGNGENPS